MPPPRLLRLGFVAVTLALAHATVARAEPSTTTPEKGFDLGEMQSPRAVAMGGANNALGVSTTGLYMNPANMALARVYHIEGFAGLSPEARRQSYGAAIVDSVMNSQHLAGGAAAAWSIMDPDGIHRAWTDVRVGLAYPLGDRLAIGGTGRYLRVDQGVASGPLGVSLASDGTRGLPLFNALTFDLGATAILADSLRLGVVGHNLTNPGTGLAPTTVAGGLAFAKETFALEGGALADFTTYDKAKLRAMAGGELFLASRYLLRGGYRYDDGSRAHAVSGGLGYVDKRWSLEIGVRRDVSGDHPSTYGTIAFRFFYNAVVTQSDTSGSGDSF